MPAATAITNGALVRQDGTVAITGSLTFQTVPDFLARSAPWFAEKDGPLVFDLAGVTLADSAGVALLLEWSRLARASGRDVRFTNTPLQVRTQLEVNGLVQALGV
jgi:phospholipid transport system transporter-binding protein